MLHAIGLVVMHILLLVGVLKVCKQQVGIIVGVFLVKKKTAVHGTNHNFFIMFSFMKYNYNLFFMNKTKK